MAGVFKVLPPPKLKKKAPPSSFSSSKRKCDGVALAGSVPTPYSSESEEEETSASESASEALACLRRMMGRAVRQPSHHNRGVPSP